MLLNDFSMSEDSYNIVSDDLQISRMLEDQGVAADITPEQFEASKNMTINFPLKLNSIKRMFVENNEIYANETNSKDTLIDMGIQGNHLEKAVLDYLSDFFLGP
jgi:hypothetical protein